MASRPPRCSIRIWRCLGGIVAFYGARNPSRRTVAAAATALGVVRVRRYARRVSGHRPRPPRCRPASLLLCAILVLALAGAAAPASSSAAVEQGTGLGENELSKQAQEEAATETTATKASTESSTSTKSQGVVLGLIGAAIVVLIGVAFVIVRDARKVAPAGDGPLAESRSPGNSANRMRKRRARAKAARQQRKRNR
jgi:hypothetical protein